MLKKLFKKIFGIADKEVTIPVEEQKVEKRKPKESKATNLNQITLKMDEKGENQKTEDKPKKKRYYKKKPKTTAQVNNGEQSPKPQKTEGVKKDTPTKTNGTTKKKYRSKKSKPSSTVQPEPRTDK
jgi:hypothetical protein